MMTIVTAESIAWARGLANRTLTDRVTVTRQTGTVEDAYGTETAVYSQVHVDLPALVQQAGEQRPVVATVADLERDTSAHVAKFAVDTDIRPGDRLTVIGSLTASHIGTEWHVRVAPTQGWQVLLRATIDPA